MAEWLCSGLQSRVRRFDSGSSLHILEVVRTREPIPVIIISVSPGGEIGRRNGLKIRRGQPLAGSSPAPGTISWFHSFLLLDMASR
jgi:hypothetical protein